MFGKMKTKTTAKDYKLRACKGQGCYFQISDDSIRILAASHFNFYHSRSSFVCQPAVGRSDSVVLQRGIP